MSWPPHPGEPPGEVGRELAGSERGAHEQLGGLPPVPYARREHEQVVVGHPQRLASRVDGQACGIHEPPLAIDQRGVDGEAAEELVAHAVGDRHVAVGGRRELPGARPGVEVLADAQLVEVADDRARGERRHDPHAAEAVHVGDVDAPVAPELAAQGAQERPARRPGAQGSRRRVGHPPRGIDHRPELGELGHERAATVEQEGRRAPRGVLGSEPAQELQREQRGTAALRGVEHGEQVPAHDRRPPARCPASAPAATAVVSASDAQPKTSLGPPW